MSVTEEIAGFLDGEGADILEFVDISVLPGVLTRGYGKAILLGTLLSKEYLRSLSGDRDVDRSEFARKEASVDRLAERLAGFLVAGGHRSYAQSESNIVNDGYFDVDSCTSVLPHKTIALLAGIGWIGKDDLLVTHEYGSGFCMCTVLTDAPVSSHNREIMTSQCGACEACMIACAEQAICGNTWEIGCSRESLVNVKLCRRCLKCLASCTWTQRYIRSG